MLSPYPCIEGILSLAVQTFHSATRKVPPSILHFAQCLPFKKSASLKNISVPSVEIAVQTIFLLPIWLL